MLVDPDHGTLADVHAEPLREARRTVDEAEARLSRVELSFPDAISSPAKHSVEELRVALQRLGEYWRQPEGDTWSTASLTAAKDALDLARKQQMTFSHAARKELS